MADTTIVTNELAHPTYQVDGSGNKITVSNPLNVIDIIGSTIAGTNNPYPSADQIRLWIVNGQGFTATTGLLSATASTVGASLYNPNASGKTLYVYAVRVGMNGSNQYTVQTGITADPALGTGMVVVNSKNGGAAPVANATYANTATSFGTGSTSDNVFVSGNLMVDALASGQIIVVPANSGIGVAILTSSNKWAVNFKWIEV